MYAIRSYYAIEPGERQRMAISVAMAGGGPSLNSDLIEAVDKQEQARIAYEADYP